MSYIYQITFHTENAILYGFFHVMHEMRLLMLVTRVLIDSLIHANAKCENMSLVFHPMTKHIGKILQCSFDFIKSHVYVVANFQGLTAGFTRLPTLLQTFIVGYICLIKNKIWVFHPGKGIYPILLHPTHVLIYFHVMQP